MTLHNPNSVRQLEDDLKNAPITPAGAVPASASVAAPASAPAPAPAPSLATVCSPIPAAVPAPVPAGVPVAASEQDGTISYQLRGSIVALNPDGGLRRETEKDKVSESEQMENDEMKRLNEEVRKLKEDLRDKISENAEAKLKITALSGKVNQLTEASKAYHDKISDLESCKKKDKTEILSITSTLHEMREKDKKSTEEREKMKKDIKKKNELLRRHAEQHDHSATKIQEYEREVDTYKRQIKEKDRDLQDKDEKISLLQAASAKGLLPDISKETEKRLGGRNSTSSKTNKALGGQSSSLENRAPTSILLPDQAKEMEEGLGNQKYSLTEWDKSLEGEISSLQDRASANILMPEIPKKLLERLGRQNSVLIETIDALERLISSLKDKNGGDSLARSCEHEVESEMDERYNVRVHNNKKFTAMPLYKNGHRNVLMWQEIPAEFLSCQPSQNYRKRILYDQLYSYLEI